MRISIFTKGCSSTEWLNSDATIESDWFWLPTVFHEVTILNFRKNMVSANMSCGLFIELTSLSQPDLLPERLAFYWQKEIKYFVI